MAGTELPEADWPPLLINEGDVAVGGFYSTKTDTVIDGMTWPDPQDLRRLHDCWLCRERNAVEPDDTLGLCGECHRDIREEGRVDAEWRPGPSPGYGLFRHLFYETREADARQTVDTLD